MLSHEARVRMCAETYGMANLRAMQQYDDNEKRKQDAKVARKRKK
jgi:hypothetical protein